MVLIAAALFIITAYVADAIEVCECYKLRNCGGRYSDLVSVSTQSISDVLYIAGLFRGLKFSFKKYLLECIFIISK